MADKPITREEKYLAYLTGDYKGDIPKPITRQERYLYELCLKGMGGEISSEEIQKAVNDYLNKNPVQPGATTEEVAQIKKNAADITSLKESTNSLKEDMGNVETSIDDIMPIKKNIGVNKFNIERKVSGLLNQKNGDVEQGIYTVTDFIDLFGNNGYIDAYMCSSSGSPEYSYSKYVFYDKTKKYISGFYDSTGINKLENSRVIIPENARYARFEFWNREKIMIVFDTPDDWKNNWVVYEETSKKNVNELEDEVDKINIIIEDIKLKEENKWKDKRVLVLGDSISDKSYHYAGIPEWDKWPYILQKKLGFTLINDSLYASGFLVNMGSGDIGSRSLINRIENHSGESYDMIILFMGINDAINNMIVGTAANEDKTADFYSAVDYCFNYIQSNFTAAKFFVLLPLEAKPDWYSKNQLAYINVLKEECEKYNVPYLDLHAQSGFNAKNDSFRNMFTELGGSNGNYTPDGLHPNQLWDNNYLAPQIESFINRAI